MESDSYAYFSSSCSSAMAVLAKIETLDGSAELVTLARNRYREIRNKIEEMDRYITGDIEQAVRQGRRIAATTARRIGEMQQNSRTLKGNADSLISTIEKTTGIRQKASRDYQNASRAFEVRVRWTLISSSCYLVHELSTHVLHVTSSFLVHLHAKFSLIYPLKEGIGGNSLVNLRMRLIKLISPQENCFRVAATERTVIF